MIVSRRTFSPEQTSSLAREVAERLRGGDVLALRGELGAGKTTFIRGLAEALEIDPREVSSPTFVIAREHPAPRGVTLIHIDAYRIGSEDELETIGFAEMLDREDAIIAIEWADRIADALPALSTIEIEIAHAGGAGGGGAAERSIAFTIPSSRRERFRGLEPRTKNCPTCNRRATIDQPHFPFCSERCQMADLNDWFEEKHTISRPIESSDELTD